jgi:quinol monooxygenase YgiN
MARIAIAGEVEFPPENRAKALEGAIPLIEMALKQKGCLHYAWTASPSHPGRVHVFEEWEDQTDLAAHLAGPAYAGMIQHLSGFSILGADTRKYRFDLREPVYGADGKPTAWFSSDKK